MISRAIPIILFALACRRNDVSDFWHAGGKYRLELVLSARPRLIPEQERYFSPVADSATLLLSVDSVVSGTAYGSVAGDRRHFPVMFAAVGGDRFLAARSREHWTIAINPQATDTGIALNGELSHGGVAGTWVTRGPSQARGKFRLAPTT
jgi:hypothetical protein